jgi:hypothetical protein
MSRQTLPSPRATLIARLAAHRPAILKRLARVAGLEQVATLLFFGVVAVAFALFLTAGVWGPAVLPGTDTIPHLMQAELAGQVLLPHGLLDGWQSNVGMGYQQFLFLGPGLSWLVVAVHWLSFGLLSIAGALKAVAIGSFVALPLAVMFLARSFGLDRRASGIAAVLSLAVSSPFGGVGIAGTFGVGLLGHELGALGFLVTLGAILRTLVDPRARWVLLTAVGFMLLCITHPISALLLAAFLVVIVPTLAVTDRPTVRMLARAAIAVAIGAALAGFWMVPAFAHEDLRGVVTSWENPPLARRLSDILGGELLFHGRYMVWLLLAGWLFVVRLYQERRRWALALLVSPFAYLWLADAFLRWNEHNVVSLQLTNRGLGYVGVLAVLPLAALLGDLAGRRKLLLRGLAVGLLGVALYTAALPQRDDVQTPTPSVALRHLAEQLKTHVPPGARFAVQRDYPVEYSVAGISQPAFWLAWASGRDTANIWNVESSAVAGSVAFEPDEMTKQPPDQAADRLARLGVTHVAIINQASAKPLLSSPRFRLLWQEEPMALLAVVPPARQPDPASLVAAVAPAGPVTARTARWDQLQRDILVTADQPVDVTVAIGWSPKWHARVNQHDVSLGRSADGLLMLRLPAGSSLLALRFEPDGWDVLGRLITLLTLGGLLGWAWLRWRRRAGRGTPIEEPDATEDPSIQPQRA